MNESILVIGSGTWGASTALELAKRGYTNVTCIDKRRTFNPRHTSSHHITDALDSIPFC